MSVTSEIRRRTNDDVPEAAAREALERVVCSEIFARSQQQSRLLTYLCAHYFQGTSAGLKEYAIATEVMGLAENYDQAEGSTVRVAIHRLRKRLRNYYETEGATDVIEIRLNAGEYAPEFHRRTAGSKIDAESDPVGLEQDSPETNAPKPVPSVAEGTRISAPTREVPVEPVHSSRFPRKLVGMFFLAVVVVMAIVAAYFGLRHAPALAVKPSFPIPADGFPTPVSGSAVRILAGYQNDEYTDPSGNIWLGDRYYQGGEPHQLSTTEKSPRFATLKRTGDPMLLRHYRSGNSFSYVIPVQPGSYEVLLGFAETVFGPDKPAGGGENVRTFTIKINGEVVEDHFDIYSDANGADTLDAKRFSNVRPLADGKIHLTFSSTAAYPALLNFLELLPETGGRPNPIRISTHPRAFIDNLGRAWEADTFFLGGRYHKHVDQATDTSVPEIYETERFGNFSYDIPVDRNRKYRLTLHFTEDYFGAVNRGEDANGVRTFDVACNGTNLLQNFDILKESGARHRALVEVFHGLKASPQGKLFIAFIPSRNYALVNAIEIAEDSP